MDFESFESMEDYIDYLTKHDYIDEKGQPLKCEYCEHTDFEIVNIHACQYGIEEYSIKCKNCGEIVGHWGYGYWEL